MKKLSVPCVSAVLAVAMATSIAYAQRGPSAAPNYDAFYEPGPDSLVRRGVPKGKVAGPFKLPSDVFPGVAHDYWVYVPAQYDGKTEVSLMVFNDGATYMQPDGYYRAVNVLDNLMYRRELPVMIAAFIDPGKFTKDGRSNRQAEYDPVNNRYSRVIVGELLPKLYAEYRITRDPERHGIGGWSLAPLRRSRWRGNGPISSARCSAASAPTSTSPAGTSTPKRSWRASANRSASS